MNDFNPNLNPNLNPIMKYFISVFCAFALSCSPPSDGDLVKAEFLHAWNGYTKYAWGYDALKPISKTGHNWYSVSFYMTPVDAFDTMIMMGLRKEAAEAKRLILDSLTFDVPVEVQSFEITIRLLGGLLSAYELDGDERFLKLAEDLGDRLLPVFNSKTGMPYRYVHLQTGAIRDSINNPAEIGTSLLEFGTLSKLTGRKEFYEKPKRALVALYERRSAIGLVGTWMNVETGEWTDTRSHVSGAIDSYYEYLWKAWVLFGDEQCRDMFRESMISVHRHLADTVGGRLWYGVSDMESGMRLRTTYGALDAFFPALLALSDDMDRARSLQSSGLHMWNKHGIEPEVFDYAGDSVLVPSYPLRPEIIESAFYLYRFTGDTTFRNMGFRFLDGLTRSCRTEAGFAHLKDVRTGEQDDAMESFFLAETLKYLYLLLGPPGTIDLNTVVLNTEAHPFKKRLEGR